MAVSQKNGFLAFNFSKKNLNVLQINPDILFPKWQFLDGLALNVKQNFNSLNKLLDFIINFIYFTFIPDDDHGVFDEIRDRPLNFVELFLVRVNGGPN
jgi:quinol-cytochrome oxidoreductase complex cytochrome b subunit